MGGGVGNLGAAWLCFLFFFSCMNYFLGKSKNILLELLGVHFFFHRSFSFRNIHTHKVNKLSCLMVPPLLGSNEAAGGRGVFLICFPVYHFRWRSGGANSLFLRIFFLFARSPKIWSCPGQRSSRSVLNWVEVSCWTDFMVVESNLPS